MTEIELNKLLDKHLVNLNPISRTRIQEAAAIAFYHQQSTHRVIKTLISDDAPQFKLLTDELALCWVHQGRHYKKLSPYIAYHQKILDNFLGIRSVNWGKKRKSTGSVVE